MSDLSYYAQCDSIEQIRSELSCIWGLKNLNDLISENIYIWGIGLLGKFVVEQFKENNKNIKGILTSDNKQIGENYKGIPFVSLDKVGLEDLIVVCSISYPLISEKLSYYGYKRYLYYEVLPFLYDELDSYYMGFEGMWETLIRKRDSIENLQKVFAHDEVSVEVLNNVLLYRYTLQTSYLDYAFLLSAERGTIYFDKSIIELGDQEVFVDCGGYIGDTTEAFIMNCHNKYKRIAFYEPDEIIFKTAQNNLNSYSNIFYINEGIGKTKKKTFFDLKGSMGGGTISSKGESEITVTTLDDTIKDWVPTYIKMDIEGSEMDALYGGGVVISSCRPKLAISVYHHPYDIFEIVDYITSLQLGYKFYLRHYSRMYDDTVLYCV